MGDVVDQEIEAIRDVLAALTPLSEKARASVLDYIAKRLSMEPVDIQPAQHPVTHAGKQQKQETPPASDVQVHIKQLKEEKKPRSANEMAAIVGYYLSNLAPANDRKKTINQGDIETYFKIAGFPLPQQVRVTLANAKTAGYFDAAGNGEYKLNAVGHNLVVHSMPRGSSVPARATKKTARSRQKQRRRNGSRG